MTTIREIIQHLRQRHTQAEISRRTGIPQSRLSRWESGSVPVSADDALKLARLAGRQRKPKDG